MSSNDQSSFLPHVKFFNNFTYQDCDARRLISGVAGKFGLPIEIRQIKIINFTESSVNDKKVVGNHKHYGDSDQWEIIIVLDDGDEEGGKIHFRYRNYDGSVREKILFGGDVVVVPPGCSLALVALDKSCRIIEISNKEYDASNYIVDRLF